MDAEKLADHIIAAIGLGYVVGFAFEAEGVSVFHADGHGLSVYMRSDTPEDWESLIDPDAHEERALQHAERTSGKTYEEILKRQADGIAARSAGDCAR